MSHQNMPDRVTLALRLAQYALGPARSLGNPDLSPGQRENNARRVRLLSEAAAELNRSCEWTPDDDGIYQTKCGHSFYFDDSGTATDHKQRFCGYCGGQLVDKALQQLEAANEGDVWHVDADCPICKEPVSDSPDQDFAVGATRTECGACGQRVIVKRRDDGRLAVAWLRREGGDVARQG